MPEPRGWPTARSVRRVEAAAGYGHAARSRPSAGMAAHPASAQTLTEAFADAYNNNPQLLAQRARCAPPTRRCRRLCRSGGRRSILPARRVATASALTHRCNGRGNRRRPSYDSFIKPLGRIFRSTSRSTAAAAPKRRPARRSIPCRPPARRPWRSRPPSFQAVATAYLDVVRDQTLLEVDRNNEEVLRKQLEATHDRFRVGEVTRTDVAQAESALAQATRSGSPPRATSRSAGRSYTRAVGHPPGRLSVAARAAGLAGHAGRGAGLAANNNFNVISATFAELAARDNIDLVRGQLLPQISVVGDLRRIISPSVTQQARHRHRLGGRPADDAALRRRRDLFADPAGGADRRAAAQPGRRRAPRRGADRDQFWATLQAARAALPPSRRRCARPRSRSKGRSRKRWSAPAPCSTC